MATDLAKIDTVIVVLMENRSFDHMLGYLSLPDYGRDDVDGLKPGGSHLAPVWPPIFLVPGPYTPYRLPDPPAPLPGDPPHERKNIAVQLGSPSPTSVYPMDGFVQSYSTTINVGGIDMPIVMGYFTGEDLPTNHFFAQNFTICDRWFASLPAGTQPNRLMAMSGESLIDTNKDLIPDQNLVYDWLADHNIKWRVYHESLPFFALMQSRWDDILSENNFRFFDRLAHDIQNETDDTFPQVIFVEPRYTNAPHIDPPHDDHAPSPVDGGQRFLMEVYAAITANPARWQKSVLVVTYDEHGGLFDHVSPLAITTDAPNREYPPFLSTGVRVPAFVISPFVEPRNVFKGSLDHTAILQLLGEKFGDGSYSPAVDARKKLGLGSVSDVLTREQGRVEIPAPPAVTQGFTAQAMPFDMMSMAFNRAWTEIKNGFSAQAKERFPKLFGHF